MLFIINLQCSPKLVEHHNLLFKFFTQDGDTALHIASSRGHLECVRVLLDSKADLDVPNLTTGNTPLHLSIIRHYTNVAMVLLHAGADFDLCSVETGDAAIHLAAREGLLGLAQSLCAFGCAVDIPNKVNQWLKYFINTYIHHY